jgi:hypothetical protein
MDKGGPETQTATMIVLVIDSGGSVAKHAPVVFGLIAAFSSNIETGASVYPVFAPLAAFCCNP